MFFRNLTLSACLAFIASGSFGQDLSPWNFTIGGGIGFPQSTADKFVNNGANFVIGGGPNIRRYLSLDAEFMWHDLPIKQDVVRALGVPDGSARIYSVTMNAIVPIPTHGKMGFYAIGGGGWYHRSGELTAPTYVPGTVCPPFYLWWGGCIDGLFPGKLVLASSSSSAWGGNVGGGITYRIGTSGFKIYSEVRYHHAPHKEIETDLLPITLGLRW